MKHISIIGAGASGIMVAATLLESSGEDYHIHLFEKNSNIGKKVLISGGGRCNVTTAIEDKKILQTKYTRGWNFIKKAMGKFPPGKCQEWFIEHGVPLKTEADQRVFPVSDDGNDIVGVFSRIFAKNRNRISIHYSEGILTLEKNGNETFSLTSDRGKYTSDYLVITTGGNAYSHTGSSGDGYAFARSLGHTISLLGPSLSSFLTAEDWTHELSGISFEGAKIGSLQGALLLTHFGISGPLAFMLSSELAWEKIGKGTSKSILFAPIAKYGVKEWDELLQKDFQNSPKKTLSPILSQYLPKRFSEAFVSNYFSHIQNIYAGSLSRKHRESIVNLLGNGITLTLLERRPGDEFVTAGGVETDEIDSETFESKLQKNLYFAGEILNVDGYTGGFSLQICWASGYLLGKSLADRIRDDALSQE